MRPLWQDTFQDALHLTCGSTQKLQTARSLPAPLRAPLNLTQSDADVVWRFLYARLIWLKDHTAYLADAKREWLQVSGRSGAHASCHACQGVIHKFTCLALPSTSWLTTASS